MNGSQTLRRPGLLFVLFVACSWPIPIALAGSNTITTIRSSPNPSGIGYSATFTATVSDTNNTVVTNGFVTFVEGLSALASAPLDARGQATLITNGLPFGPHTIRADYSGNANPPWGASSAVMVHTVTAVPLTQTARNSTSIALPTSGSANPYPSTIVLSNLHQIASRVTVTLHEVTGYLGDFDILLVNPSGSAAYVISDAGTAVTNVTLFFSDDAPAGIGFTSSPASGTYKPSNFGGNGSTGADNFPAPAPPKPWGLTLATVSGTEPNGAWRLFVTADGGGSATIAGGWSLTVESVPKSVGTWDGGGSDGNWSTAENWVGDAAPHFGDELVFPANAARFTNNNDYPSNALFSPITFTGSNYVITGNPLQIMDGLSSAQSFGTNVLSCNLWFLGAQDISVPAPSAHLQLNSVFTADTNSPIKKSGSGALIFGPSTGNPAGTFSSSFTAGGGVLSLARGQGTTTAFTPLIVDTGGVVRLFSTDQIYDPSRVIIRNGGLLDLNGYYEILHEIELAQGTVAASGELYLGYHIFIHPAAGESHLTGNIVLQSNPILFSNNAANLRVTAKLSGSPPSLSLVGSGVTVLDGTNSNTYSGPTLVNGGTLMLAKSAGAIAVPGALAIGDGVGGPGADALVLGGSAQIASTSSVSIASSGRFDLGTNSQTIAGLTGTGIITGAAPAVLTILGNGLGPYSGNIVGSGGLIKSGANSLTLSGSNTFTGPTVLSNGTLAVNGYQASSPITVEGGMLTGTGRVGSITAPAGRVSPGDIVGTMEVNGNLLFGAGSILEIDLNGGLADRLRVFGSVNLGGAVLNAGIIGLLDSSPGLSFTIIENDGIDPVVGTFHGLPEGIEINVSGVPFRISYAGGTGNDVVLTQVPFANTTPNPVPALGASAFYPWPVNVSGIAGSVARVSVVLSNINHTRPDDLDVLLQSPSGQTAMLMSDAGGDSDLVNATLIFDDSASSTLPDNGPISSGTYRLANYEGVESLPSPAPLPPHGSTLATFTGTNPNGTWWLWIADDASGDSGSISSWSLSIVPGVYRLLISANSANVTVKWPNAANGYTLSSASAPVGPWVTVTNSPLIVGGENVVTLSAGSRQFFRLSK